MEEYKYLKIIRTASSKQREAFLKRKKPLVLAAWERYCRRYTNDKAR
jgi:hypothetical protein